LWKKERKEKKKGKKTAKSQWFPHLRHDFD